MQAPTASFEASLQGLDEAQLREFMESCTRDKGPYHPDTIHATSHLVKRLCATCKPNEALPLARRALEHSHRVVGSTDHVDLLPHIQNLATCLSYLGQLEEEEALLIKVLDLTQRLKGHEDRSTITCCWDLATCQTRMGKHTEAEALHRRAVEFYTRLLGPDHSLTANSILGFAKSLLAQAGKEQEGESLLREALELHIRVHGLRHRRTVNCMLVLGQALERRQEYVEAERMMREALEIGSRVLGPDYILVLLDIMRSLEFMLLGMGRRDEAEGFAHRALEACTRVLGAEHELTRAAVSMVQSYAPPVAPPSSRGAGAGGRPQQGTAVSCEASTIIR